MKAAVFLDRDNTLIANDGDLGEPESVRLIDGVAEGLRALRAAGYRLIVVTNQAGVARGLFTEDAVDAVHQRIAALVDEAAATSDLIDRFYYCPYHPDAPLEQYRRDHPWRKPGPGMLMQAARDLRLDLARSWMVGDQPRDVEAGRSAGCRTVLLSGDDDLGRRVRPTAIAPTFPDAVEAILEAKRDRPASAPSPRADANDDDAGAALRAAVASLTDELRNARLRRAELSATLLAAGMFQLLAVMLAVLGLLQLDSTELFVRWMLGATLAQLVTMTILLLDLRG